MRLKIPIYQQNFKSSIPYLLLCAFLFINVSLFSQPHNFKKVKAKTVDFSGEECETFTWKIKFTLENGCPNGGWIVQSIDSDWEILRCDDTEGNRPFNKFFEAWEVPKNKTVSSDSYPINVNSSILFNDNYSFPIEQQTKGELHVKGQFAFIENPVGGSALDPTKWVRGSVPQANMLMATRDTPTWWNAMENSGTLTTHDLDLYWVCCGTQKDTTYFDTLIVPPIVPDTIIIEEPDASDQQDIINPQNQQAWKKEDTKSSDTELQQRKTESSTKATENLFQIFPIPAKNKLFIQSAIPLDQTLQIRLINITGQVLIDQQRRFSSEASFDISSFPPGVYFVLIQNLNGDLKQKYQIVK